MKCLVFLPNHYAIELSLKSKAIGFECLNQVCDHLNTIETSFFGLQYATKYGFSWLILRKRIDQQLNTRLRTIKFYFKVKFFVPPHYIQQNSTRHLFYLNICQHLENRILNIDHEKRIKLIALIAQIDFGDFEEESFDLKLLYSKWIPIFFGETKKLSSKYKLKYDIFNKSNSSIIERSKKTWGQCDLLPQIIFWHQKFVGYSSNIAKSLFLKLALEIPDLGVDYFTVISNNKNYLVGIGPSGLTINSNNSNKLIAYNKLKEIQFRKSNNILKFYFIITINYSDEHNATVKQKFLISLKKEASTFYRLLTERRVFYSFPLLDNNMITIQYNSNYNILNEMVNTISSSTFKTNNNNNKQVQKPYVFDVDRTLKQFYDEIRRFIYHYNEEFPLDTNKHINYLNINLKNNDYQWINQETTENKSLCKICFDQQIRMAFMPCGHTTCESCCQNIKNNICPFCKTEVKSRKKLFI